MRTDAFHDRGEFRQYGCYAHRGCSGSLMNWLLCLCTIATALAFDLRPVQAQLKGHGGPVRALAVSADGKSVLSGSFDTAAIRWSLATESAEQVLRFHLDAVNAGVFLKDCRMATE